MIHNKTILATGSCAALPMIPGTHIYAAEGKTLSPKSMSCGRIAENLAATRKTR